MYQLITLYPTQITYEVDAIVVRLSLILSRDAYFSETDISTLTVRPVYQCQSEH